MAGELEPPDPLQLRISDDDRHRVADVLRDAAAEGRIDLDELDQRLEATYGARTYGDLVPITRDLPDLPETLAGRRPTPPVPRRQALPAAATYDRSLAIMGECVRRGAWLVPAEHTAFALMGSVMLDLREASFAAPETRIRVNALMAGVDIVVDEHTHVVVEGVGIMGDFSQGRDKVPARLSADSPVVRVNGVALMSGVRVVRKGGPVSGSSD
jgi:hypothetical protein